MGRRHGKGEFEYYEDDGRIEKGEWVNGDKQGEFECYDQTKTLTHRKIYDHGKEIQSEEVKQEI